MRKTIRILMLSVFFLSGCSAEETLSEPAPSKPIDNFESAIQEILKDLRSTDMMERYYRVVEVKSENDDLYTEESREYLFFDIRFRLFNSINLTKADGQKSSSAKDFDHEFIKKYRTEGILTLIKSPKIMIYDQDIKTYELVTGNPNYKLYGWQFTLMQKWYNSKKFWNNELDLLVGGKRPFFIKEDKGGDKVTIKNAKYIMHSPDWSTMPEFIYIIEKPFGGDDELSYELEYLR